MTATGSIPVQELLELRPTSHTEGIVRDSPYEGGSRQIVSSRSQSGSRTDSPSPSHRGPGAASSLDRYLNPVSIATKPLLGVGEDCHQLDNPSHVSQYDQRSIVRNKHQPHQHSHAHDQRSVHQHVHQHAYDQRSMQVQHLKPIYLDLQGL